MTTLSPPSTLASQPLPIKIQQLDSPAELAATVTAIVAEAVHSGVASQQRAQLVFSGGSTPALFLPMVAKLNLPWAKITLMLADERWVDGNSADSNTALLNRTLRSAAGPAHAKWIPLKNDAPTAEDGVAAIRQQLPPVDAPYDLILLGMGNDGHFASLFPHAPDLASHLASKNTDRVVAVPAPTTATPYVPRISFTLAEIMKGKRIVLVLQGAEKRKVLERALEKNDPLQTPVVALLNSNRVEVLWCP
jgi:6-phosphogluconolactonase